jgi:hypothetical protein
MTTLTSAPTRRTVTAAEALQISEAFSSLMTRNPDLAAEVNRTFRGTWGMLNQAVINGAVQIPERKALQIDAMADGIRSRLADTTLAAA